MISFSGAFVREPVTTSPGQVCKIDQRGKHCSWVFHGGEEILNLGAPRHTGVSWWARSLLGGKLWEVHWWRLALKTPTKRHNDLPSLPRERQDNSFAPPKLICAPTIFRIACALTEQRHSSSRCASNEGQEMMMIMKHMNRTVQGDRAPRLGQSEPGEDRESTTPVQCETKRKESCSQSRSIQEPMQLSSRGKQIVWPPGGDNYRERRE